MSDKLRIGILGAAKIAPLAITIPAEANDAVEVTGIAARDQERAKRFSETHNIAYYTDSYEALIERDDVDLIYIGLPISFHAEWALRALQAGKHVLCEKPFAMNAEEARQAIAASGPDARLIEAFHYRYHSGFKELLRMAQSGEIGSIQKVEATFCTQIPNLEKDIRYNPDLGGGAMMDLGCYPLHQARTIAGGGIGKVISAKAETAENGIDLSMTAELEFPNAITASLTCSMVPDEFFIGFVKVIGERGELELVNPIAPHFGAKFTLKTSEGETALEVSSKATYNYQLEAIVSALREGTGLPTEGQDILDQQTTLDAIYAASGLGSLRQSRLS